MFAGPTDVAYLPAASTVTVLHARAAGGSRSAGRRTDAVAARRASCPRPRSRSSCAGRAVQPAGAQLRHPAARWPAGAIIACEVITPGRQLVVLPRAQARRGDRARVGAGGDLLLRDRRRPERRAGPRLLPHLLLAGSRDRPAARRSATGTRSWCRTAGTDRASAAPGHDMYYLNVMAGPRSERAWKITDHPDQAWVRGHLGRPADRPATGRQRGLLIMAARPCS